MNKYNPAIEIADTRNCVWVCANAGTGKTFNLVSRIMSLLLDGVKLQDIVCITYTEAAAGEMKVRLLSRASHWRSLNDTSLFNEIKSIKGNIEVSEELLQRARNIFIDLVDNQHYLKLQTIHSFCTNILHKFPFETGINVGFGIFDTSEKKQELLEKVVARSLIEINNIKFSENYNQDDRIKIISYVTEKIGNISTLKDTIENILFDAKIRNSLHVQSGRDFNSDIDLYLQYFDINNELFQIFSDEEKLNLYFYQELMKFRKLLEKLDNFKSNVNGNILRKESPKRDLFNLFTNKTSSDDEKIKKAKDFIKTMSDVKAESVYKKGIIDEGTGYELIEFFSHVKLLNSKIIKLDNFLSSFGMYLLVGIFYKYLSHYKNISNMLDFNDLIFYTEYLLEGENKDWVLYNLDAQINHIMVDEAQDTNKSQWNIVRSIFEDELSYFDFDIDKQKSLFVVGDVKQSIYRFQGTDPKIFVREKTQWQKSLLESNRKLKEVDLKKSYRSAQVILDFIDFIFKSDVVSEKLQGKSDGELEFAKIKHYSAFDSLEGEVAIVDLPPNEIYQGVVDRIKSITSGSIKVIKNKVDKTSQINASYHDILILLEKRKPDVLNKLFSVLRYNDIPYVEDVVDFTDSLMFKDLVAIGEFLNYQNDDYYMAGVLKSPFCNFNDQDLLAVCANRGKLSVFENLTRICRGDYVPKELPVERVKFFIEVYKKLMLWLDYSNEKSIYQLYNTIYYDKDVRHSFLSRLGKGSEEIVNYFFSLVLDFEASNNLPTLTNFLKVIKSKSLKLKRTMDNTEIDAVRIMSIHGSKGLEAPFVILIDLGGSFSFVKEKLLFSTCLLAEGEQDFDKTDSKLHHLLWNNSKINACDKLTYLHEESKKELESEKYRLLYVALTRASQGLYIFNLLELSKKNGVEKYVLNSNSWASFIYKEFENSRENNILIEDSRTGIKYFNKLPDFETQKINLEKNQNKENQQIIEDKKIETFLLNLNKPIEDEKQIKKSLAKVEGASDSMIKLSPFSNKKDWDLFLRGRISHTLLQYLSDADVSEYKDIIKSVFNKYIAVNETVKNEIINEVMVVLEAPQFKLIFNNKGHNEVTLMGLIDEDIALRQIDRVVFILDEVWIIDYKTNFLAKNISKGIPRELEDLLSKYQKQINGYKSLLESIYSEKKVRGFILWTKEPYLMEVI